MLLTNHYNIEVGFDTSSANPILHDIAFEKIQMFFEVLMPNSIIINKNSFEIKTFNFDNNYIEMPEMLNDQTLGSVIFLKLMSLVGEDLEIQYIKISSTLGRNIRYTINNVSPEISILVPSKEEWWGDDKIKFDPWWMRSDPATYDEILTDEDFYKGEFSWDDHFKEEIDQAKSLDTKSKFQIIKGGKDEVKFPK